MRQNYAGVDQQHACGCLPPDVNGAVGRKDVVEIVNNDVDIYKKSNHQLERRVSTNAFFANEPVFMTDPRVLYDFVWNRFVAIEQTFPDTANRQFLDIAVSKTANATGAWIVYRVQVNGDAAHLWDYPELGMDQGSLIVTANFFGNSSVGTVYFFKKSDLYAGRGATFWSFSNVSGATIAPPIVEGVNPTTYLTSAPVGGSAFSFFGFQNTDHDPPSFVSSFSIAVPAFTPPPSASQPGTTATLDTLDARINWDTTQIGNQIYATHTENLSGFPTPKFFQFDAAAQTIVQSGFYFASGTSNDWNASLQANTAGQIFVTYSSDDPAADINPQQRVGGRQPGDPSGSIDPGVATATSTTVYTLGNPERWGDTSGVAIDPTTQCRAYNFNETIVAGPTWGTNIAQTGYC